MSYNENYEYEIEVLNTSEMSRKNAHTTFELQYAKLYKSWNKNIESRMAKLSVKCKSYAWMHSYSHSTYGSTSMILAIIVSIFSLISSLSIFTVFITNNTTNIWTLLTSSLISFIAGVITIINKALNFDASASTHINAENDLRKLSDKIDKQLASYRYDRLDALVFDEWANNEYNRISFSSPKITKFVLSRYKKHFANNMLFDPDKIEAPEIVIDIEELKDVPNNFKKSPTYKSFKKDKKSVEENQSETSQNSQPNTQPAHRKLSNKISKSFSDLFSSKSEDKTPETPESPEKPRRSRSINPIIRTPTLEHTKLKRSSSEDDLPKQKTKSKKSKKRPDNIAEPLSTAQVSRKKIKKNDREKFIHDQLMYEIERYNKR